MINLEKHFISLIIPAFKQEKTIEKDILRITSSMNKLNYDYEIIGVVDGRVDKTFENAKKVKSSKIKIVGYNYNYGKGYAIRYGMVRSKGDIVGFLDAGMDLNPNGLATLIGDLERNKMDIVIGSKRHPLSKVNYPMSRRMLSFLSQVFIKFLFGVNVRDTQVGMKFFRRKIIEDVLPRLLVKKFAFDIEILAVAYYLGYKKISEAPIELNYSFKKSIISQNLISEIFKTFWDSLAIFYRLKILRYYDDNNKRKWRYDPELKFKVNVG